MGAELLSQGVGTGEIFMFLSQDAHRGDRPVILAVRKESALPRIHHVLETGKYGK